MRRIVWSPQARADVRAIDRTTAMRVLTALHHFAKIGKGDVKRLRGEGDDLRLRVGDYRLRFTYEAEDAIRIHEVKHRSEAYR